ncbi:Gp138 family membrane-puncturing spike protein [Acetobacter syzygii]|uniref:Gp138 family membrane-puncturing spike protein n=1 Tax=Acetobacter syzygii TaxID=146476 RepID=UPI0020C6492C|nr:Gp138 family membrane-puncturing spike protein [Acetobacter syzygii]
MQDKLVGSLRAEDGASAFNATNAAIRRILAMLGATAVVQVRAVRGSGLDPVGMVDVQPMVHQQDGAGRTVPHGLIHNVPYLRLQGGRRALICDPAVGDIGAIIVCGRDIASVKATRQPAAPGSYRQHDYADSLYIGGFLNAAPQEYAGWVGEDFVVQTAGRFIVNATQCQINCATQVAGSLAAEGDVQAGQVSLHNHTHTGVQPGSGQTGTPH